MNPQERSFNDKYSLQADIEKLIIRMEAVTTKVDALLDFSKEALVWNRQIIKWLLAVVCVIALGRSALDLGKQALRDIVEAPAASAMATTDKEN